MSGVMCDPDIPLPRRYHFPNKPNIPDTASNGRNPARRLAGCALPAHLLERCLESRQHGDDLAAALPDEIFDLQIDH